MTPSTAQSNKRNHNHVPFGIEEKFKQSLESREWRFPSRAGVQTIVSGWRRFYAELDAEDGAARFGVTLRQANSTADSEMT